jgi:Protein of unknown function (DUF3455)
MKRKFFVSALLFVSPLPIVGAACTSTAPNPAVPVPDNLEPAAIEQRLASVAARGVQVYECRAKKDDPGATEWAFVAPEADLFDAQGRPVGKHYAGPKWESADASKIVGTVQARADAPRAGAIPWLLLATRSEGPEGAFAKATSIQRINTVGGVAPAADDCTTATLGKAARVAYTADYVMFGSK